MQYVCAARFLPVHRVHVPLREYRVGRIGEFAERTNSRVEILDDLAQVCLVGKKRAAIGRPFDLAVFLIYRLTTEADVDADTRFPQTAIDDRAFDRTIVEVSKDELTRY